MLRDQRGVVLRFAADDGRAETATNESGDGRRVRRAAVNPHNKVWKSSADAAQYGGIVAGARNRVEIRDIERRKRMHRKEAADDVYGVAGWRKRRFDWPVRRTIADSRMHHLAAHEVNDRNCAQAKTPSRRLQRLALPCL